MATEYKLSLNIISNKIENYFKNQDNKNAVFRYIKNYQSAEVLNIEFYNEGLMATVINSTRNAIFENINFRFQTSVIFRADKEFENIIVQKKSLINLLIDIIKTLNVDLTFVSNGENLLLYVKDDNVFINKKFGFWDSNALEIIEDMSNFNPIIINSSNEIEFF